MSVRELGISPSPWRVVKMNPVWTLDATGVSVSNFSKANARLISAAPDLYAALLRLVNAARDLRAWLSDEEQVLLSKITEDGEKALRKAAGTKQPLG